MITVALAVICRGAGATGAVAVAAQGEGAVIVATLTTTAALRRRSSLRERLKEIEICIEP
jgi:hypothetical protein